MKLEVVMPTHDEFMVAYHKTVAQSGDRSFRAWVFPDDQPPIFPSYSYDFSCVDSSITIVDQFRGKPPFLLNYEYLLLHEIQLRFIPTLVLDSQIVSYLTGFLDPGCQMPAHRRRVIHQLLDFAVTRGCDYNPFFYWLESHAKNAETTSQIVAGTLALLRLHSMDKEKFLETGRVHPDGQRVQRYLDEHGLSSLEQIAQENASSVRDSPARIYAMTQADLSYVAVLKMILIEAEERADVVTKFGRFKEFMIGTFGINMARESFLATLYFSGHRTFVPRLQRNSNPHNILGKAFASAWDLVLLRMPEVMLASAEASEVPYGYICTADVRLGTLAKFMFVGSITCDSRGLQAMRAAILLDESELTARLGESVHSALRAAEWDWHDLLATNRRKGASVIIGEKAIAELRDRLEQELRFFCSGR